jgi:hypothetical protein
MNKLEGLLSYSSEPLHEKLLNFDVHGPCIVNVLFQVQPTRCNVTQYPLLLSMFYMFQAVFRPSSGAKKLYIQHLVYVKLVCCYS